jgi:hypothetical protein
VFRFLLKVGPWLTGVCAAVILAVDYFDVAFWEQNPWVQDLMVCGMFAIAAPSLTSVIVGGIRSFFSIFRDD